MNPAWEDTERSSMPQFTSLGVPRDELPPGPPGPTKQEQSSVTFSLFLHPIKTKKKQ